MTYSCDQSPSEIDENFLKRFCSRDTTLWAKTEDEKIEVSKRLGWLTAADWGLKTISRIEKMREVLIQEGFTNVVVLGMGGSSLAPEVFSEIFRESVILKKEKLELSILDSTDPVQIIEKREKLPLKETLFIVSSKSGGTAEVNALEKYFWDEVINNGIKQPGSHFIAITDPGSPLEKKGIDKKYREVILANPNVGGRYSALIEFGLVPAVLMGVDGKRLLEHSKKMEVDCSNFQETYNNQGVKLGEVLANAYLTGKDKLTLITDNELQSMGSWIEQLIAESSGKNGKGILPVDMEPLYDPEFYGQDRIFIHLSYCDHKSDFLEELSCFGHTIFTLDMTDLYDLGAEFLRWEIGTAIACAIIGVNAFNQPNVQLSKSITQEMIEEIKSNPDSIIENPIFTTDELEVYGDKEIILSKEAGLFDILNNFLTDIKPEDYIAINAFVTRKSEILLSLQELRMAIGKKTNLATTLGFGPRFLHSTGQLHKGGKNNGHFIILTQDHDFDMEIPGEMMLFGTLQLAQAIGDMRALQQQHRKVIRLHFKKGKYSPDLLVKHFN